jgi:hypothetical protein
VRPQPEIRIVFGEKLKRTPQDRELFRVPVAVPVGSRVPLADQEEGVLFAGLSIKPATATPPSCLIESSREVIVRKSSLRLSGRAKILIRLMISLVASLSFNVVPSLWNSTTYCYVRSPEIPGSGFPNLDSLSVACDSEKRKVDALKAPRTMGGRVNRSEQTDSVRSSSGKWLDSLLSNSVAIRDSSECRGNFTEV